MLKKLLEKVKTNEIAIIWSVAVLLLFVLLITTLLIFRTPAEKKNTKNVIPEEVDLNKSTEPTKLPTLLREESEKKLKITNSYQKELSVYRLEDEDWDEWRNNINKMLSATKIEHNNLNFQNSVLMLEWYSEDYSRVITIEKNSRLLKMQFNPAIDLAELKINKVNPKLNSNLLQRFSLTYLPKELEYTNINILELDSGNYKVVGTRSINSNNTEFKLYNRTVSQYTDYIVFTPDGKLFEAIISFATIEEKPSSTYPTINKEYLEEYILNSQPEVLSLEGDPVFISGEKMPDDELYYNYLSSDFIGDGNNFPDAHSCEYSDGEIVYYYEVDVKAKTFPVLRIECIGEVDYKNGLYEVPQILFINIMKKE